MGGDACRSYKLTVEIQDNGIIRDPFGWVVGECRPEWLQRMLNRPPAVRTDRVGGWQLDKLVRQELRAAKRQGGQMNDTHGETGKGWYGFDLDGALAKYDGWKGIDHIGEPVKPMVDLMKRMHDEGKVVKIVTARVAPRRLEDGTVGEQFTWMTREPSSDPAAKYTATRYIQDWCEESAQLGFIPEIVYQKDRFMIKLYDGRPWWRRLLHMKAKEDK